MLITYTLSTRTLDQPLAIEGSVGSTEISIFDMHLCMLAYTVCSPDGEELQLKSMKVQLPECTFFCIVMHTGKGVFRISRIAALKEAQINSALKTPV